MPLYLGRHAKKAFQEMVIAAEEKGATCLTSPNPEKWTGWLDEEGRDRLPTKEEANDLCADCPLKGAECREWKNKGDTTFGVLDGEVIDKWREAYRG